MENDPKPYKFMKESIKKQPPDWKKIVLLIAGWLSGCGRGICGDRAKDCRSSYQGRDAGESGYPGR